VVASCLSFARNLVVAEKSRSRTLPLLVAAKRWQRFYRKMKKSRKFINNTSSRLPESGLPHRELVFKTKKMNKIKLFSICSILFTVLLFSNSANAGRNNGNYVGSDGCLHVWTSYTLFGITWSYHEDVFCNNDGTPLELP
jgi:hypothetical protein